jgi:dihydrofolate reductase
LVEAEVAADTFFPTFAENDWQEIERCTHAADDKNQYAFTFVTLTRKH